MKYLKHIFLILVVFLVNINVYALNKNYSVELIGQKRGYSSSLDYDINTKMVTVKIDSDTEEFDYVSINCEGVITDDGEVFDPYDGEFTKSINVKYDLSDWANGPYSCKISVDINKEDNFTKVIATDVTLKVEWDLKRQTEEWVCDRYNTTKDGKMPSDNPNIFSVYQMWCLDAGCKDDYGPTKGHKCVVSGTARPTTSKVDIPPVDNTCEGIFGSFYNDLKQGVKAYKIIAPLAVLLFSVTDYLKAIFSKDAEGLKDANKKLIKRGILLVVLFFLPTLLDLMIHLLIGTEFGTCLS